MLFITASSVAVAVAVFVLDLQLVARQCCLGLEVFIMLASLVASRLLFTEIVVV